MPFLPRDLPRIRSGGAWLAGAQKGWPVLIGYLPISATFGLAAEHAGWSLWRIVALSALVFAGTSQFTLVGLMAVGVAPVTAVVTALLINARHVIYGPLLVHEASDLSEAYAPWVGGWGLTDEVFALLLRWHETTRSWAWILGLEMTAYAGWVGGTVLGLLTGAAATHLPPAVWAGMGFALPALFVGLLIHWIFPSGGTSRRITPEAAGLAVALWWLSSWGCWQRRFWFTFFESSRASLAALLSGLG